MFDFPLLVRQAALIPESKLSLNAISYHNPGKKYIHQLQQWILVTSFTTFPYNVDIIHFTFLRDHKIIDFIFNIWKLLLLYHSEDHFDTMLSKTVHHQPGPLTLVLTILMDCRVEMSWHRTYPGQGWLEWWDPRQDSIKTNSDKQTNTWSPAPHCAPAPVRTIIQEFNLKLKILKYAKLFSWQL